MTRIAFITYLQCYAKKIRYVSDQIYKNFGWKIAVGSSCLMQFLNKFNLENAI